MSSTGGKGVWGKMCGIGALACRAALRLRGLQVLSHRGTKHRHAGLPGGAALARPTGT